MTAPTGEVLPSFAKSDFRHDRLGRVCIRRDGVNMIGEELARLGARRSLIVTGRSLAASGALDRVRVAGGDTVAATHVVGSEHVPAHTVERLVHHCRRHDIDSLIALGGSSPIDLIKLAAFTLMQESDDSKRMVQVAIPTTLSAAEYTYFAGMTDPDSRVKTGKSDPSMAPDIVIADPVLALETPDWLWASTGIKALDHAIEAIYSPHAQPLADLMAGEAIRLLRAALPVSCGDGADRVEARGLCQQGAWFATFPATNVGAGLSHALGHQIGPRWNIAHGVTSCITLPHVMRYMADIVPDRFAPIARALGLEWRADAARLLARRCAIEVHDLIDSLGLPHSLREAGVDAAALHDIVDPVLEELNARAVPPVVIDRDGLKSVIRACHEGASPTQ